MAQLLKGAPAAGTITNDLAARANRLKVRGIVPTLALVRLGERSEDISYQNVVLKRCEKVGITVKRFFLNENCTCEDLLRVIAQINSDLEIHGCLIFRPLPDKDMEAAVCKQLSPAKDVDGMTDASSTVLRRGGIEGFVPCTAQACLELLEYYGIELCGRKVCVVGRSAVAGKPVRELLEQRGAKVTVCHSKTEDLPGTCRRAEVVVSAAGKAGVITAECVSAGQIVIDVGINEMPDGKLCGDVDFDAVEPLVSAITPVPGGVGAVTTAVLCKHVIEAAERV